MTSRVMPIYNQPPTNTYQSYPYHSNVPSSQSFVPQNYHHPVQQPMNVSRPQGFNMNPHSNINMNQYGQRRNLNEYNLNQRQNFRSVSPMGYRDNVNRPNLNQIPIQRNNYQRIPVNHPPRSYSPTYQSQNYYNQFNQPQMYNQPQIHTQPPINPNLHGYSNPNIFPAYQHSPYSNLPSTYYQPANQGYVPLYTPTPGQNNYQNLNSMLYNQMRRNTPEQSLNSNFNYQQANFDVNYSVQQNLVHCVICNQTYKANQKKQHLQLHRQKARNVNIRPVDEQQLKRLQKYNKMAKKGLIIKPIVEPDQFNVQYNPNQFVLKKVTKYKDIDAPFLNQVQIQTQNMDGSDFNRMNNSPNRSSRISSPQRNLNVEQNYGYQNNRNTNTRFNNDSIRQQQKIFLSDKLNESRGAHGQSLNDNYQPHESYRNTQKRSDSPSHSNRMINRPESDSLAPSQLGYHNAAQTLKYRNAQSVSEISKIQIPSNIEGYQKHDSIRNVNESSYKGSRVAQIPLRQIIEQAQRHSQQ